MRMACVNLVVHFCSFVVLMLLKCFILVLLFECMWYLVVLIVVMRTTIAICELSIIVPKS